MSGDIVKRLRALLESEDLDMVDVLDKVEQAANAIEALQGEIAELKGSYEGERVNWAVYMRVWMNRATAAEARAKRLEGSEG